MELAVSKKSGDVFSADGVKYTTAEVAALASSGAHITLAEHKVKKLFGGEIVSRERPEAEKHETLQTQSELDIF
ncbi:MAG: hypothetical protein FWC64_02685 [Treponema sp.]|nr:hypothetical protein [Treponema sp.]